MRIYRKPKSADLWLLFADWFQLGNSSRCFACRLNNVCRHIGNELKWKDKRRERAIDQFNRVSSKVVVFLWHFPVFIGKSKFVSRSLIVAQKILQITGAQSFWSEQRCSFTHDSLAFVVICERQIRTCSWSHHFICQRWKKLLRQTKKCEEKRKWKGINIIKVASLWLFQSADVVVDCKSIETIVDSCLPLLVLSLSLFASSIKSLFLISVRFEFSSARESFSEWKTLFSPWANATQRRASKGKVHLRNARTKFVQFNRRSNRMKITEPKRKRRAKETNENRRIIDVGSAATTERFFCACLLFRRMIFGINVRR